MFFCSVVFLCVASSVGSTGFYTEDEPFFYCLAMFKASALRSCLQFILLVQDE